MTRKKAYHGIKKRIQEEKKNSALKEVESNVETEPTEIVEIPIPPIAPGAEYQIILEHDIINPKFRAHADLIKNAIRKVFKNAKIDLVVNYKDPRNKSFELTVLKSEVENPIWSGLSKGPPNKLKLPDVSIVIKSMKEHIKN